jgi:hypothetical protein
MAQWVSIARGTLGLDQVCQASEGDFSAIRHAYIASFPRRRTRAVSWRILIDQFVCKLEPLSLPHHSLILCVRPTRVKKLRNHTARTSFAAEIHRKSIN